MKRTAQCQGLVRQMLRKPLIACCACWLVIWLQCDGLLSWLLGAALLYRGLLAATLQVRLHVV
jgi:hypothetical protein